MIFILLLSLFWGIQLQGQVLNIPLHGINEYSMDRMQVLYGDMSRIHTSARPLLRNDVLSLLDSTKNVGLTSRNRTFLLRDNSDLIDTLKSNKPFLKYFYVLITF